ncbi:MAG TPA: hypothetical protein PLH72_16000 [Vicinamibacterales bacterium]|nr:hypothetical protein [Vicinamibacterales bacterium]
MHALLLTLIVTSLAAAPAVHVAAPAAAGQAPSSKVPAYRDLTLAQRRLFERAVEGNGAPAGGDVDAEATYERLPPAMRMSFDVVTGALEQVSLSDAENGEILGTALDTVVGALEREERQPSGIAAADVHRLAVLLAPGAVDALRRSVEFRRLPNPPAGARTLDGPRYAHVGPPGIEIAVSDDRVHALVVVARSR